MLNVIAAQVHELAAITLGQIASAGFLAGSVRGRGVRSVYK